MTTMIQCIYIFFTTKPHDEKSRYIEEKPPPLGKSFTPKVFIGVGRPMDHFPVLENEKWPVAKTESDLPLSRLCRDNPTCSLSIPSPPLLNLITEKFLAPPSCPHNFFALDRRCFSRWTCVASKFIVPCQSPGTMRVPRIESLDIYIYIYIHLGECSGGSLSLLDPPATHSE